MYYVSPNAPETPIQRRRRLYAAKLALAAREREEHAGHCKCSDTAGNLLHRQPGGCPKHPKGNVWRRVGGKDTSDEPEVPERV